MNDHPLLRESLAPHDTTAGAEPIIFSLADPIPSEGKVNGYVRVPYSTDLSAYGFIALPIVVVANGEGPTVLLLAGSHGDEFEGQVALGRLARTLMPADVTGRVIIMPTANAPAAREGKRNSPIDGYNLNRIYPGDVRGSPTSMIANYIERHLMAESDIVLDLHSGGRSLRYQPCATMMDHPDPVERSRRLAITIAFGAPAVLVSHGYEERNSSGAAKRAGATRIGTEIGGGAGLDVKLVDLTYDGVVNVLRWSGVLPADPAAEARPDVVPVYDVIPERDYLYALSDGVFEPLAQLGETVRAGDLAGLLHDPSRPWTPPQEIRFRSAGLVVCQRVPGLSARGDCLFHLASEFVERYPNEIAKAAASTWVKDLFKRRRPRVKRR